jgi:hypothetical protein
MTLPMKFYSEKYLADCTMVGSMSFRYEKPVSRVRAIGSIAKREEMNLLADIKY